MKYFTKKIIALGMSAALITTAITACQKADGNSAESTAAPAETAASQEEGGNGGAKVVGGWSIPDSLAVTPEAKDVFDKAVSQLDGFTYEPVELLATQVVAGTNYCFLCQSTVKANKGALDPAIVYINLDPSGNAKYLRSDEFSLDSGENLDGGWINADSYEITPELESVMAKATETLTGASYKAIASIASQVVSGRNYAILCQVTPVVPDATASYALVYVYEDTQGTCKISNVVDITLDATSESGTIK